VTHVVRPGETVYRIARHYGVSADDVVRANRIRDVTQIQIGERLVIPGTSKRPPETVLARTHGLPSAPEGQPRDRARREGNLNFSWPVGGRLSSGFGWRSGGRHEGIDIPARRGTSIRAAEAGRVIHSGRGLGDYGRVVILKHAGRYSTVYAHTHRNLVRVGEFVEKGQVIAEVGKSGNATGAHLHFELRRNRRPQDPLQYLPPKGT
jgi:murein DD-endopeptidase MepM/ murein hydrolase activator NlpD